MIYLASPYTHENAAIVKERVELVTNFAARALRDGHMIYSPIVHNHQLTLVPGVSLPTDWEFWRKHDLNALRRCDALWVLCLAGWQDSQGVQAEIGFAYGVGKLVRFFNFDGTEQS